MLDVDRAAVSETIADIPRSGIREIMDAAWQTEGAIALADRVVVLSAGPGTRPIGDFRIDLPRPRLGLHYSITSTISALLVLCSPSFI